MHILIIEAVVTGHHAVYLERIAAAYMDAGHVVTVTVLKRDTKHAGIGRLTSKYGSLFKVVPLDDARYQAAFHSALGDAGRELALRSMFGQVYRIIHQEKPVDYVFLPYLDYCLYALGLLGSPFGSSSGRPRRSQCRRRRLAIRHGSLERPRHHPPRRNQSLPQPRSPSIRKR